jgi:predicted nucleic acid-binding Zn ribbon protein
VLPRVDGAVVRVENLGLLAELHQVALRRGEHRRASRHGAVDHLLRSASPLLIRDAEAKGKVSLPAPQERDLDPRRQVHFLLVVPGQRDRVRHTSGPLRA